MTICRIQPSRPTRRQALPSSRLNNICVDIKVTLKCEGVDEGELNNERELSRKVIGCYPHNNILWLGELDSSEMPHVIVEM